MAGKNGRLEAQVTVPSGGWSVSATNTGGGPTTATLAAGTYYPTALITALVSAINAAMGAPDFAITCANTEGGSGRVSISTGSGTWSLSWTSTALRDLLGFAGNITAVSSTQVSDYAMKGVWLPDSPLVIEDDLSVGRYVTDLRQSIGPTGQVLTLVGNSYQRVKDVRWTHVSKDRTIGSAVAYPMTWERFLYETQFGSLSYFAAGAKVNLYTDATTPTLLGPYYIRGLSTSDVAQAVQGWAGRWGVAIPELIVTS